MAGTVWNDVNTGREVFSMTHLHPQLHKVEVSGVLVEIEISFGFHVFTDQKQVGKVMSFRGKLDISAKKDTKEVRLSCRGYCQR